jgi:hypothetical protein
MLLAGGGGSRLGVEDPGLEGWMVVGFGCLGHRVQDSEDAGGRRAVEDVVALGWKDPGHLRALDFVSRARRTLEGGAWRCSLS